MMFRRALTTALAMAAAAMIAAPTAAQDSYPSKPIRIVVPYPPGGQTDAYARILAQSMQAAWGHSVVVDNRAGANGLIGTNFVKQAAPDGYTLLFTANSAHTLGPLLREPRPFDSIADFTPVAISVTYPMYLLIDQRIPATTIAQFVVYAKARPGQLNYSSAGAGSGGHLACELFTGAAGIRTMHVPYKGSAPAQVALMAGEVQMFCDSVGNSQALVKDGKMRGLAVTAPSRLRAAPDIPTMAEAGMPEVNVSIWLGLLGPSGMPAAIAAKINAEVVRIMQTPELRQRAEKEGVEASAFTPAQFTAFMQAERERYGKVIREKQIKAD
jgi:tripartite-type tricarboxylate transporter receptor subunit TctC